MAIDVDEDADMEAAMVAAAEAAEAAAAEKAEAEAVAAAAAAAADDVEEIQADDGAGYRLCATVWHAGTTAGSGHYIADVRQPRVEGDDDAVERRHAALSR